nr:DNA primase large subunit [Parasteatoda tepidariorum]
MQFNTNRQRRQQSLSGKLENLYPFSLQFYKFPPTDVITLEEFEDLALERLKVLRLIERAGAKFNKNSNEYREMIINELRKSNLSHYVKITIENAKKEDQKYILERRRDHISHFILRLAYCRREDLRRWFITQEVDLFRLRFMAEHSEIRAKFMKFNDLNYDEITSEEKERLSSKLYLGFNHSLTKVLASKFYKVPFTEVLDLIKNRKVYLERGLAYIPEEDLVVTVVSAYRAHLSHALAVRNKSICFVYLSLHSVLQVLFQYVF